MSGDATKVRHQKKGTSKKARGGHQFTGELRNQGGAELEDQCLRHRSLINGKNLPFREEVQVGKNPREKIGDIAVGKERIRTRRGNERRGVWDRGKRGTEGKGGR